MLGEIAARTDGVPLFVEELTKAVLEAGAAAGAAAVPASLHASLMARLDRVPGVKEVAQVAACLGREFAYPLLAAVSPVPEPELRAALDRLAAAELVFARGEPPEAAYTFKHALVRDAAHESLLRRRRQRAARRGSSRCWRSSFPETVGAEPELLARHCSRGGADRRGGRLLAQGRAASRRALGDGGGDRAAEPRDWCCLPGCPTTRRGSRHELELQTALGGALIAAKGWAAEETGKAFARARELCQKVGDDAATFSGRWLGNGRSSSTVASIDRSREVSEELLRLAQQPAGPRRAW